MKRFLLSLSALFVASSQSLCIYAADYELSGKVDVQARFYQDDGQFSGQDYHLNLSAAIEPEFYWEWNSGRDSLTFKPFYRHDQHDDERNHGDIRELLWRRTGDNWELRTGLGKVFWGVTEFQHLVDVINQTDAVESFDAEEKLGQAMVNLSLVQDWGIVDVFVLPGFRERTFPGRKGRLRSGLVVNTDAAEYESSAEEKHIDLALRWSHSVDVFDAGVYWFKGTDREPVLQHRRVGGKEELVPYYQQVDQFGVDLQATIDSWLLKFEAINKRNSDSNYTATQLGFEYTFYGISESAADLGVLLEYGWDERDDESTSGVQNDLFLGARFTLNDTQNTELLLGAGYDMDYNTKSFVIEGNRRIGNNWKLVLDGRFFSVAQNNAPSAVLRKDDYVQLTVEYYY